MSEIGHTAQVTEYKGRFMYDFRVNVSYESDFQPVVTIRTTYRSASAKSATVRAARWANQNRPKGRRFRSWVIVVENISERDEATR